MIKKLVKNSLSLLFIIGFFTFNLSLYGQEKFTVCLDAGHGGTDPGNLGGGYHEKDIALKIALEVGKLLEREKINVVYTRDDDTFIGLKDRGEKAHSSGANVFVSIHCDAFTNSSVKGAATFVLALRGNGGNLRVAQKENSVIAYEENYETKYRGFDPNAPESAIGITILQEEFLDESLLLASFIQESMVKDVKRNDRLVKQDNFQVLRETFMPSVLVETGFLTNKNEGAYLNSTKGQKEIALAIYDGIIDYKKYQDANTVVEVKPKLKEKSKEKDNKTRIIKGVDFKVQIASSSKKLRTEPYNFKGLKGIERVKVGNYFKYYYGKTSDYSAIKDLRTDARKKGFTTSFIVAFKAGKKVSVSEVLKN